MILKAVGEGKLWKIGDPLESYVQLRAARRGCGKADCVFEWISQARESCHQEPPVHSP